MKLKLIAVSIFLTISSGVAASDVEDLKSFLQVFYKNQEVRKAHVAQDLIYTETYLEGEDQVSQGGIEILKGKTFFFPESISGYYEHQFLEIDENNYRVDIQSSESGSYVVSLYFRVVDKEFVLYKIENMLI
ncbi:hypothetical protein [Microbulbifer hainanensis]|uniref:hypothetical protein n=1 Tax=Microbulbifer hainanensis TaxID=2735675 RepID=UPI0018675AF9|nr:hypothetical protein [Microbulbifer hainanensis]